MGEYEIKEFLEEQKKLNPDKWFSMQEIRQALKTKGLSENCLNKITQQLGKLVLFGIIDYRTVNVWENFKVFRYR